MLSLSRALVLGILALGPAPVAHADCQSALRILADDLQGLKLNDKQNQELAAVIRQARQHCWVQREQAAMDLIGRARQTAGLRPASGEFDWENVPLESLEPATPRPPLPASGQGTPK
jgi:hypothetical protein